MVLVNTRFLVALALALGAAACKPDTPDSAAAAQAGNPAGRSPQAAGDNGAARGGRAGGRPTPSITLAATDVAPVRRETIEAGIPIAGDLHPIETVGVRARIEGDLVGVFVREGQRVAAGELLAQFESGEQETSQRSAEADVSAAKTEVATAEWNYDQSKELFKAGAIAERDLKTAEGSAESARARLAAANARLKSTSNMARDTKVLSPTAGIVEKRLVESGERVSRGAQLFSIVRNSVLELAAAVPARQATLVAAGQAVHFIADGRNFDGRVARVSPTIDPVTRSVTVFVQIPNAAGALKGGTFASGRVVQRTLNDALVVPTPALRQSQENGRTFVYRIAGRNIDVADVQIGIVDERAGKAEILAGLNDGDRVVVGNVGTLGRGMQVTVLGSEDQGGRGVGGAGRGGRGGRGQRGNTK